MTIDDILAKAPRVSDWQLAILRDWFIDRYAAGMDVGELEIMREMQSAAIEQWDPKLAEKIRGMDPRNCQAVRREIFERLPAPTHEEISMAFEAVIRPKMASSFTVMTREQYERACAIRPKGWTR